MAGTENGDTKALVPAVEALPPVDINGLCVPSVPGRLTDAYDVQKPIGKGGYAIVYKGIRREDGRIVAVKKVEIFEMTQKKRERCLQEVTLLQQLSHPFIIQMYDAFIDENMLIIIFEWAPAGDLKRLIKKTSEAGKTLDEASIWNSFFQITDALRYMHQHRIMHRDIKPANVLVGANGALKIGDLGLGRQLSEQTMEAFSKVGTPYYVSPEVVRGAGYDWKSDVWSMGCLLYELACLRSPFEMEGANLYDVFQKISKGDYPPLPTGMFSAPLRNLVVRMLSVDPVKRPELDEVWSITQGIVQAQTKTRQDVHSSSEVLFSQLCLLESDVVYKLGRQNGKRVELPPPPTTALRQLHPLFFAEPLTSIAAANADAEQKRQLGTVLAIFAWLLRLCARPELALAIEAQLEQVPGPAWMRPRASVLPQPPTAIKRSNSSGSSKQRGARTKLTPASENGDSPHRTARGGSPDSSAVSSPAQPASSSAPTGPCTVLSCSNLLKGAEAVKKAAQGIGLSTEFAPVNALATGHGRAVCCILQDMLHAAAAKVQPLARKPRYHEEPEAEEAPEDLQDCADADAAVFDSSQPLPGSSGRCDDDCAGNEDDAYYNLEERLGPGPRASGSGRGSAGSGQPAGESGPGRPPYPLPTDQPIDPIAWRAELERLTPLLSRIMLPSGSGGLGNWGEWHHRWQQFKGGAAGLASSAPGTASALAKTGAGISEELDRIATTERRLNASAGAGVQQHRGARERLLDLQQHVMRHEDLMQVGNAALSEINARIEEVGVGMQERAGSLDGGAHIQTIQNAIRRLKIEMGGMDLRIGVVQQQLLARQHKNAVRVHLEDLSDEDWLP